MISDYDLRPKSNLQSQIINRKLISQFSFHRVIDEVKDN